jgi:hypothetical protein
MRACSVCSRRRLPSRARNQREGGDRRQANPQWSLIPLELSLSPVWAFAFRVEFLKLMPVDGLHHAHPSEHHRPAILRSLGDAMRSRLNLFHTVLGFRDLFCQPCDGIR